MKSIWWKLLILPLLVFASPSISGCGRKTPPGETQQTVDVAERQAKARRLFLDASHSKPREKVDLLRRLLALYPDFEDAVFAHLQLCLYLRDPVVGRYDEAFQACLTFAARHPKAGEVLEVFSWLGNESRTPPPGWNGPAEATVLSAWLAHVQSVLSLVTPEDGDLRAVLHGSRGVALAQQGDLEGACQALEEAVRAPCEDGSTKVSLRWRLALLCSQVPEAVDRCRALLDEVAELRKGGAKGPSPEEIEDVRARLR